MLKGKDKVKNITTTGDLIRALYNYPDDTPIMVHESESVQVIAWHDYDTDEFECIEIEGE